LSEYTCYTGNTETGFESGNKLLGVTLKPIKERINLYLLILISGLIVILGLLVSGYDYTKARGFFQSDKREAMSLSESLAALPSEYVWFIVAAILIFCIVELFILMVTFIGNKYRK
jgi:hypothetical protein